MRTPLLILVAVLSIAAPARALEPLDAEHAGLQLSAQFSRMRQGVPQDDAVTHARIDKMEDETRRAFQENLRRFPDRRIFAVDVAYVAGSFERLILPRMAKTSEIIGDADLTAEQRRMRLAELAREDGRRTDAFNDDFYRRNRPAMEEAARWRTPEAAALWAGPNVTDAERVNFGRSNFLLYSPLIGAAMDGTTAAFSNAGTTGGGIGSALGQGMMAGAGRVGQAPPAADVKPVLDVKKLDAGQVAGDAKSWLGALKAVNEGAPRAYSEQSGAALQSGRFDDAARLAKTALELDPSDKNARFVLASTKGRVSALDAASASRSAASLGRAALKPSDADPGRPDGGAADAGGARAASGRADAAPAAAGNAAPASVPASAGVGISPAAGPARASTRAALAEAKTALRLGDADAALVLLDKALEKDPGSAALLGLRAQTYGRLGRWEEALKDADVALASMPGSMPLLTTKALAENRTGRWREALATSERMIAAEPGNAWGYAARAHAWGGLGNREAMLSDIKRAASLDASFAAAAEQAAQLQLPTDSDFLFLFPGEAGAPARSPAAPPSGRRARDFGLVTGAALGGGLLLALALLSFVLARLKESAGSLFTRDGPVEPDAPVLAAPRSVPAGLIRGQYALSRQIGAGGMGMVYEGTDRSLGRRVAIKKMREELRVNARERDRFIIEAKTVASLHHPNIVDIYAIAEEGEDVYLVFEFIEGKTVHDLIQSSGRLGLPEAVSVTRSMGEALSYAHSRGVIHRDMKPSNAMLSSDGVIKVMDFGIARMAKDAATRYSMTNNVVGTPPYMAPEQEQGVVRKESDVYALGVCAYEMLTGKLPFIGHAAGMLMNKINMSYVPPSRASAGLPEALDEVFVKAFQADPDRRYRTPLEFVTALAGAAGGARKAA